MRLLEENVSSLAQYIQKEVAQKMKAFVYCAVGDVRFKRESMYSIATLHPYLEHSLGEYRILVVTDDPGVYAPVSSYPELILLPISSQTVDDWTLQGVYNAKGKN